MSQAHLYCRFMLWWASKKTVKSKIRLVFLWLHFSVISFFHKFTVCNWEQSSALLSHGCSPFPFRLLGIHLYSVSARLCSWSLWGLFTVKYSSDTMLKCRNYSSLQSFLLLDAVTLCRPLLPGKQGRMFDGLQCALVSVNILLIETAALLKIR